MKKSVLNNVIIAFTDVIPQIKDPSLSWIWQMANSFGAVCSMDLTGKTTHLIAVKVSLFSLVVVQIAHYFISQGVK
jgi:RNA polymerase II subunit A-like phosphatase